jgi:hypothetical protein
LGAAEAEAATTITRERIVLATFIRTSCERPRILLEDRASRQRGGQVTCDRRVRRDPG